MENADILHIAQDEKFINSAIYQFDLAFPGQNRFVIVNAPANPSLRYIDSTNKIEVMLKSEETARTLLEMSKTHEVVVFHGLNGMKGWIFKESSEKQKFMGIIYGAEIYNQEVLGKDYLGEKTKQLEQSLQNKTIVDLAKDIYRKIRYKNILERYSDIDMKRVIHEIPVLGTLPDYSRKGLTDDLLFNDSVKKVPFTYYPLDFIIRDEELRAKGPDILLGNSASATNNHMEALDLLSEMDLSGKKVYVPLSYGSSDYANAIVSYGRNKLGDKFVPLTTFLPLSEYNRVISRCGVVIMNHYRPQAMGNLIASLYMGAKVYLNDTHAYRYFKSMGCHVYLIEEDLPDNDRALDLLSPKEAAHNRRILESKFSTDVLVAKLRKSFGEIFHYGDVPVYSKEGA